MLLAATMSGTDILTAILQILFGAFTQTGTAMGGALSSFAQAIFITTVEGNDSLSIFASILVVFAAISLALSLFRYVLNWLVSWGRRNR